MSLKNALKGVFFEDDDAPAAPAIVAPTPSAPVISNQPAAVPAVSTAETQRLDQALQQKLIEAVNVANIAGYKTLDDMLDSLEDVVPDVNVRYKKALEICAKQGHSPSVLLNDIDRVIGVLEEERRIFEADQKHQFQDSVGALTRSVETLTKEIDGTEQQLLALQQKLAGLKQKREADSSAVGAEQAQIDHVDRRFMAIFQAMMKEIQGQRVVVEQKALVQP